MAGAPGDVNRATVNRATVNRMANASSRLAVEIGSIVAGKYRIDRILAEGGMGVVVAATHLHLEQSVALKFLRGGVSMQLDALARFTREAKAAAQLRSEYVARVIDAGVTEDGTPYMAMEYLEGQSLARTLQTLGRLDVASAVEYAIQACEGLAEAHSRRIVHRDIKPYNLFLVERAPGWNAIKILDFGISKVAFADGGNVATGVIIGSPCYMSPEQLRATATVDQRTDLWSLGATLYELLVGHAAFDASQSLPELITAILDKPAPRVRDARSDVPAELDAVVDRCLAKDREERFSSAGELATALLPFATPRARIIAERAASMTPAFRMGLSERPSSLSAPPSAPPPSSAGDAPEAGSQLLTSLALGSQGDDAEGAKMDTPKSPAATRRWLSIASAAAAAVAVAGVLVLATVGKGNGHEIPAVVAPVIAPPQATTRNDAPPAVTLAPAPTGPERVELVVRVSPSTARIAIDDKVVDNPFVASYPKDRSTHRIVARAWGYEPKTKDVTLTADTMVDLELDRHIWPMAPPSPPAAPPSPRPPPPVAAPETPAPAPTEKAIKPIASALSEPDVDLSAGHAPLRPIEAKDPYAEP
jgi:eukaryotic-like serine/threonine-protein kinase